MEESEENTNGIGEYRWVPISSLRLDAHNPRIPASIQSSSQEELAVILEIGFEAFAVAQSIATSGYFNGEPLLVIASPDEQDAWTVVEGNRRLTALIGLTVPTVRDQFAEADRWEQLVKTSKVTSETMVPVVVHLSREETHAQVAKAHVLGKLQWRPYAQAMYIAARVEEGRSYAEVAEMIGITKSKVADLYRDQAIVAQAQSFGFSTGEVEKAFSVLTVAMGNSKLRDHIGTSLGSQLSPGDEPVPAAKAAELGEVITWIFGSEDEEPRISDSRQISQLGSVVGTPAGLKALREGDSLEQAKQKVAAAGMDPRERLVNRLNAAKSALISAADDLGDYVGDAQVRLALDDISSALEALRSTVDGIEADE